MMKIILLMLIALVPPACARRVPDPVLAGCPADQTSDNGHCIGGVP